MTKFQYSNASDLEYWQGIRYLKDNYYLLCGTNKLMEGILYIGDLLNYNSNNNYIVTPTKKKNETKHIYHLYIL
jgi:hypothetical protein